jgi:translation initiation factor IF-3
MNQDIKAPEVRLIGDDGKMMGVMSAQEALQAAQAKGLDLIEIAPQAKPPTCKIMDYGKWKYENKKKEKEAKKKQTVISIKEIQIRPRTEDHDLETKLKNATKFLLAGDKVKVNLRFSGREMAHQDIGLELLKRVTKMLEHIANVEAPPKKEGRQMFVLMSPDAAKIKDWEKKLKAEGKELELEELAPDPAEGEALDINEVGAQTTD